MQLDENQISLKAQLNGRDYYLVCDRESPLGEMHDILCMIKNHVINSMQNADKPKNQEE